MNGRAVGGRERGAGAAAGRARPIRVPGRGGRRRSLADLRDRASRPPPATGCRSCSLARAARARGGLGSPARGLVAFAFLFPLAGLGDRPVGGADAIAWPMLLFAGFAAGWTFRFLYDFESLPDPSRADRVAASCCSASGRSRRVLAVVRRADALGARSTAFGCARSTSTGSSDVAAIRDEPALASPFSPEARRSSSSCAARAARIASGPSSRRSPGCGLSAAVAVAERLGLPSRRDERLLEDHGAALGRRDRPERARHPLRRRGGRRRGLACAPRRGAAAGARPCRARALLAAGLVAVRIPERLRCSRSSAFARCSCARRARRAGAALAVVAAAVLVLAALRSVSRRAGGAPERASSRRSTRACPLEYRVSSRPVLWASAVRLFGGIRSKAPASARSPGSCRTCSPSEGRSLPVARQPRERLSPGARRDGRDRIRC